MGCSQYAVSLVPLKRLLLIGILSLMFIQGCEDWPEGPSLHDGHGGIHPDNTDAPLHADLGNESHCPATGRNVLLYHPCLRVTAVYIIGFVHIFILYH